MKISLNTLSPLNAVTDSKSGTAAAVSNMMNYYVDAGKAVPFNIGKKNLPVTPSDPLAEIAEWHFSEVDMVKVGKAYYEITKSDDSVMPVGVNLGTVTLSDNGSGGFLSSGGEEIMGAEHIASADGVTGITTVERTVGKVASCCSSDGTVILYGGANGAYSTNSGTSWTALAYNFVHLAMNGVAGSVIWGATASALYYSTDNGATWTSKVAGVLTSLKMINSTTAQYSIGGMYYSITTSGSAVTIDEAFSSETKDNSDLYFNTSGLLMHNGSIYLQSAPTDCTFSQEPLGSSSWIIRDGSPYKTEKGYTVSLPGSETSILATTPYKFSASVYQNIIQGASGNVYKNGVLLASIPSTSPLRIAYGYGVYISSTTLYKLDFSTGIISSIATARQVESNPASSSVYYNTGSKWYRYNGTSSTELSFSDMYSAGVLNDGSLWINCNGGIAICASGATSLTQLTNFGHYYDGTDVWSNWVGSQKYYRGAQNTRVVDALFSCVASYQVVYGDKNPNRVCAFKRRPNAVYCVCGSKLFVSDDRGFGYYSNGYYTNVNSSLVGCSIVAGATSVCIGGSDGIYKCDTDGTLTFIGATISSCKMGGNSPFIGTNVGAVYLLGITAAIGQRFWNVSVARAASGYNITTLATNTSALVAGKYILIGGVTGDPTPIIDSSTYKQMILFRDNNSIVWAKRIKSYLQKFFQTPVFSGIDSMFTYFPDHITQFGARFAMAGGYEVTTADNILNGNFDSSLALWIISNVTWGSAYGQSGGGALIANGYLRQSLPAKSFCIALVKGSFGDMAKSYQIIPYSGSWYLIILGFQTAINLFSSGSMYVDSVRAYNPSPQNTTVSISDVANYEEFYNGSGSQQKVPSSDNVINGIVPIGKSLYVIKDNSTGKIDETGDVNNPYYVTEEYVMEGGSYPVRCSNSFIVVRKRPSIGDNTEGAEIYVFNGQGYDRLNATWNNEWSKDSPFDFGRLHVGSVGDLVLIGNSSLYTALIEDANKVGVVGFSLPGTIDGDITDGAYNSLSPDRNITVYTHNSDPDAIKRLKGVSVLPEQDAVFRVWKTDDATVISASSPIGSCGFNLSGSDFFIKVDADGKIGQIIINEDTIMPRLSK